MSELSPRFIVPRSPIASIGRAGGRCRTFRTRSGFQRAGLFLHRTVARTIRVSGEPPAFDGFDSLPSKVLTRLCLVCPLADEGRKLSSAPFRCRVPCARDPTWQFIVMPKWRFEDQPYYPKWKEAIERVASAQMKRGLAARGTPERDAIEREYEAALAAFRSIAEQVNLQKQRP
jgi:hypothetical protein